MKGLDQEQHIQLLQFMNLMQTCKTEEELQELKEQYYNIPRYEFLQEYISEKKEKESFSSYKTNLIYDMDKYQRDYKFVYGENFPIYRKESMPNNKTDYTVLNLLNEISECDDIEVYQKLLKEKNSFPKVKIEALSSDFTGIYFSNSLPDNMILNSPESNFNTRKQLVEAGYSPFTLPSVEDVKENGFDWLYEEVSHFKETLNPNFIEMEKQMNQEAEFNENEYEEEFDDFMTEEHYIYIDESGNPHTFTEKEATTKEAIDAVKEGKLFIEKNGQNYIMRDEKQLSTPQFMKSADNKDQELEQEDYIHSEEFIAKFGDWKKAERLEKLRNSESVGISGNEILQAEDLKEYKKNAIQYGKSLRGEYKNIDSGNEILLTASKKGGGIYEILEHDYKDKEHLQSIAAIPQIIENSIYISSEKNEDVQKHPNIDSYEYYLCGLKIANNDYTVKAVVAKTLDGNRYYDHKLTDIEKGKLLDFMKKYSVQTSSVSITTQTPKTERFQLKDKRLYQICQCPQINYLNKNLEPSAETIQAVKDGKLYIEKDENGIQILHDENKGLSLGKELSEIFKNQEKHYQSVPEWKKTLNNLMEMAKNEENEKLQNIENPTKDFQNNNSSAPRPRNVQELHKFFINNPYVSGTPVPTIAMRNEQSGHSTFIEGYEFARLEDIGKPNLAFFEKDKKTGKLIRVKPDGQTVVLTKPGFREEIDKDTGEKKLVPDESKRKFIKISRDLYEQAIKNSEIIAKRNPKTKQERDKMIDDYREAANLDEREQRANTASNFWHNYQAGVMTLANNKQEAMAFAKRLVNEMIPSERKKFATMVKKYEKLRGSDGKHLSYDQRIIDFYDNMGLKITSNSIWRDHIDDKYNTLDAIKQNTEVFDKEGQHLDKTCRMKIGDTIKMSVTVDSALNNKKIKLPIQEYRLVAHSKDNNSVALISTDGKQKIIKNRDDFINEVQKIEKKQLKKQQKQDRYESISM